MKVNEVSDQFWRGRQSPRRVLEDERGAIAILAGLAFPAIVMLVGGMLDFASIMYQRSVLQSATDAAAISAAKELSLTDTRNTDFASIGAAIVRRYVEENARHPDAGSNVSVDTSVHDDPLEVRVAAKQVVETFFRNGFGFLPEAITATATARVVGKPNICLLALAGSDKGAISLEKSAVVTGRECAVFSNSLHSDGIEARDTSQLTASLICSAGGVQDTAAAFTPPPLFDCPQFNDPLAERPEPTVGVCPASPEATVIDGTTTLSPGTYCGGLQILGGADVTLTAGTYVIKDGPLVVNDGGSITGKGVGFFLTGSGAMLQLGRKSSVNLEAPGAGVMAGLLFHASRTDAKAALHQIMSENAQNLVGTIYLPTGELRIDGSAQIGAQAAYTAIVAETVRIYGGPHIILNSNYEETDVPVPVGIKGTGQPIALVN